MQQLPLLRSELPVPTWWPRWVCVSWLELRVALAPAFSSTTSFTQVREPVPFYAPDQWKHVQSRKSVSDCWGPCFYNSFGHNREGIYGLAASKLLHTRPSPKLLWDALRWSDGRMVFVVCALICLWNAPVRSGIISLPRLSLVVHM